MLHCPTTRELAQVNMNGLMGASPSPTLLDFGDIELQKIIEPR